MGWGLSIGLDADGYVVCSECDFETTADDYVDVPMSAREFIRDAMDRNHHSEIDMARDEIGLDAGREACREAFEDAKGDYEGLEDEEKMKMHEEYIAELKEELDATEPSDPKKTKRLRDEMDAEDVKIATTKAKLEEDIARLQYQLKDKESALQTLLSTRNALQAELNSEREPDRKRLRLQQLIHNEVSFFEGFVVDEEDE
jgi:chromosome segregation ATPase